MTLRNFSLSSSLFVLAAATSLVGCGGEEAKSCDEGSEGCACYPNKTCNDDLQCLSKLCVDPDGKEDDEEARKDSGAKGDANAGNDDTDNATNDADDADDADNTNDADDADAVSPDDVEVSSDDSDDTSTSTSNDDTNDTTTDVSPDVSPVSPGGVPEGSPVAVHGQLSVVGTNLVDKNGTPVQLKGVSSMWLNWEDDGYAEDLDGLLYMRDNWNLSLIRVAMGVEANDSSPTYLTDPEHAKAQVETIVDNAIAAGVYVIIDWHDHEAIDHQVQAMAFFGEMAAKYGDQPNVLYEVFNEPDHGDEDDASALWETWSDLKPYHEAMRDTIRTQDPDNVIILGTPSWDQDVDAAAASPVSGSNLMYTFHFYACTHTTADFLATAESARSSGLPLFVTEWGAATADGIDTSSTCIAEAGAWHDWMDSHAISWAAWKFDNCSDATCFFVDDAVPTGGNWTEAQLNGLHPQFAIERMKRVPVAEVEPVAPVGPDPVSPGCSPTGTCAGDDAIDCDTDGQPIARDCSACALLSCGLGCCDSIGYFGGLLTADYYDFLLAPELVASYQASSTSASLEMNFNFELVNWAEQTGSITFKLSSTKTESDMLNTIVCLTTDQPDMLQFTFENEDNGCSAVPYDLGDGCFAPLGIDVCWEAWLGDGLGPWNQLNVRTRATPESTDANTFVTVTSVSIP